MKVIITWESSENHCSLEMEWERISLLKFVSSAPRCLLSVVQRKGDLTQCHDTVLPAPALPDPTTNQSPAVQTTDYTSHNPSHHSQGQGHCITDWVQVHSINTTETIYRDIETHRLQNVASCSLCSLRAKPLYHCFVFLVLTLVCVFPVFDICFTSDSLINPQLTSTCSWLCFCLVFWICLPVSLKITISTCVLLPVPFLTHTGNHARSIRFFFIFMSKA